MHRTMRRIDVKKTHSCFSKQLCNL